MEQPVLDGTITLDALRRLEGHVHESTDARCRRSSTGSTPSTRLSDDVQRTGHPAA
jgi:hypothetical protein